MTLNRVQQGTISGSPVLGDALRQSRVLGLLCHYSLYAGAKGPFKRQAPPIPTLFFPAVLLKRLAGLCLTFSPFPSPIPFIPVKFPTYTLSAWHVCLSPATWPLGSPRSLSGRFLSSSPLGAMWGFLETAPGKPTQHRHHWSTAYRNNVINQRWWWYMPVAPALGS